MKFFTPLFWSVYCIEFLRKRYSKARIRNGIVRGSSYCIEKVFLHEHQQEGLLDDAERKLLKGTNSFHINSFHDPNVGSN